MVHQALWSKTGSWVDGTETSLLNGGFLAGIWVDSNLLSLPSPGEADPRSKHSSQCHHMNWLVIGV